MLNLFLCGLFQASPGLITGFAMDSMHQIKANAPPKWVRVGVWVLAYLICAAWKMAGTVIYEQVSGPYILPLVLTVLLAGIFFYEGTIGYKAAVVCVLTAMVITAEIPAGMILWALDFDIGKVCLDYTKQYMVLVCMLGAMTSNTALFLASVVWRKFKLKKRGEFTGLWLILPLPVMILLPTALYLYEVVRRNHPIQLFHILSMVGALFFMVLMLCLQFNQAEKTAVSRELNELRHQREMEQNYYESVEARREELAKIRHDYNNILTSVLGLLDMGKQEEAEKALRTLLGRVEGTREFPYCGVPIVNAILSDKEMVCRKNKIHLRTDLLFSEKCSVAPLDLCSIFSNLLDNAIRACEELPEERRTIDLSARNQGDYLLIRCDNPAEEAHGHRPKGTGYGKKILKDIAERYQGEFRANYAEGVFTARLILLSGK